MGRSLLLVLIFLNFVHSADFRSGFLDKIQNKVESVNFKKIGSQALDSIGDAVSDTANDVKNFASKEYDKCVNQKGIKNCYNDVKDSVVDTYKDTKDSVKKGVNTG